jgi:hypothetical protein
VIVTVTPNPAMDRTLEVGRLRRGGLHRVPRATVEPGGKGINVARMLAAHGVAPRAVFPAGGLEGEALVAMLAHDFPTRAVVIVEPLRVNVAVVEPGGRVTKLNEEGPELTADDGAALLAAVREAAIGCLHTRLARARGARRVFMIERSAERLALAAERLSPDAAILAGDRDPVEAIRDLTEGRAADVVIVAAASGAAQEQALDMAAPRGRVRLFAGLPKDAPTITVDANRVHYSELSLIGVAGSTPAHNTAALGLIADGHVPVKDLITHRIPLERVHEAIDGVRNGAGIKYVITP